jgi:transposase
VAARRKDIAPLVNELIEWMKRELAKLSRHNEVAKAFDYMLKRIDVFTRFLEDGRICLSNNAAERQLRGIALGRKSWLFDGSDRGGERAAVMLTLIQTCRLHDVDPRAWLADVLARINDHAIHRLNELLPWNWSAELERRKVAA